MKDFDDFKAELLRDPAVWAEYDARAEEFEIAIELIAAARNCDDEYWMRCRQDARKRWRCPCEKK